MAQRSTPSNRMRDLLRASPGLPSHRHAPGLALLAVLALGFGLALFNPATFRAAEGSLLDGSRADAWQRAFDDASPLQEPGLTVWGTIDYLLFRQGRPGLVVGRDGWLFSATEFAPPAPGDDLAIDLDAVAGVGRRLAERGVDLLVVPVPAKARVYPEALPTGALPDGVAGRYRATVEGLRARGVLVADPLEALREAKREGDVFLRTDTHWSPDGARAAAEAVAAVVRARAPFEGLDATPFRTTRAAPEPYRGDLTAFLPLGPLADALGPPPDALRRAQTVSTAPASGDFFAAVAIPVTLVGTSYSADPAWNFVGALREALGADVLDAADSGQGPAEPMLAYLEGPALAESPPALVVWEIPERYVLPSTPMEAP